MWASGRSVKHDGNYIETQTNGFKWRLVINGKVCDEGLIVVVGKITLTGKLKSGKYLKVAIVGFPLGYHENWTVNGVKIN